MEDDLLVRLGSVVFLGVGAQWLAWRLRLPSILLLLGLGFVAGPWTGFVDTRSMFGELLFPLVSLSVGIILFEGGLGLKLAEIRQISGALRNLIIVGALVTWLTSAAGAHLLLGLNLPLAVLLGAILVVTGPTVIGPLLRHVRPVGPSGTLLQWEGIVIDPVGATLALLVLEAVLAGEPHAASMAVVGSMLRTIVVGVGAATLGAGALVLTLRRYLAPDHLQNPATLMAVVATFTVANALQREAGLLAVTIMGVILANQRLVTVKHILEFKENLRVLLIGSLFILLMGRLELRQFAALGFGSLAFLVFLILVVRPLAVTLATPRSGLTWRERAFLAWMAPRGIVAAAVSALFALRLAEAGVPQAELLVPVTFLVIAGTVSIYSLTASPLARWLGIAQSRHQGFLVVGADGLARAIATTLQAHDARVLLVDTNYDNVLAARAAGLPTVHGNILTEELRDRLDLRGIGHLLALTPNDEVNSLAAIEFAHLFGRAAVYQLWPRQDHRLGSMTVPTHMGGRLLFGHGLTHRELTDRLANGAAIGPLHEAAATSSHLAPGGDKQVSADHVRVPLFHIEPHGLVTVVAAGEQAETHANGRMIGLLEPREAPTLTLLSHGHAPLEHGSGHALAAETRTADKAG